MLIELDLDRFVDRLRIKTEGGKRWVFDPVRGRWLVLQPEEFVRQLLFHYLTAEKGYNRNRIAAERAVRFNELDRRWDLLVYDPALRPFLLVECKAPRVPLSRTVFEQAARYNTPLAAPYLLVCNGPQAYCCRMDYENGTFTFLPGAPEYPGI
jgi:hypothetical protein